MCTYSAFLIKLFVPNKLCIIRIWRHTEHTPFCQSPFYVMKIICILWILFYYCSISGYVSFKSPTALPRVHEQYLNVCGTPNLDNVDSLKLFLCFIIFTNISCWLLFLPITLARYAHFSATSFSKARVVRRNSISLDPSFYLMYIILVVDNLESFVIMLLSVRDVWPTFRFKVMSRPRLLQVFLSI